MRVRPRCRKTGKIRFATAGEAERELARAQELRAAGVFGGANRWNGQREIGQRVEQGYHPCFEGSSACGGWHLTAYPRPERVATKPRRCR